VIIVITTRATHPKTGQSITIVSHGYDTIRDQTVTLPPAQSPAEIGAILNKGLGEWILPDIPERHQNDNRTARRPGRISC
jgi:hypothetical protein